WYVLHTKGKPKSPVAILTTHVGSLPRGSELAPLLLARDQGKSYNPAELDQRIQAAIDEAVAKQAEAGIDVLSDGEMGKVGYSSYITERLSGLGVMRRAGRRGIWPHSRSSGASWR